MSRLLGVAAAAAIAFVAFLGGHSMAGGNDHAADATKRSVLPAGSAPVVVASAGRAVSLPVLSVRELPVLAAPHQRRLTKKATSVPQTAVTQTPVAPAIGRTITPSPPAVKTKPKTNPSPGGNGGGGGYFDDSG